MLKQYLKLGDSYEYEYRGLTDSQRENLKTAQNFYDSIHDEIFSKYTDNEDSNMNKTYDYDEIDPDFADYLYLYKFAEKYYD
jgi:hypothetical protein